MESLKSLQGVQDKSWTELKKTMGTSASLVGFCKSSTVSWENTRYLIVFYILNSIISTLELVLFWQTIISDTVSSALAAFLLSCSEFWLFDFVVTFVSWPATFGDLFSAELRGQWLEPSTQSRAWPQHCDCIHEKWGLCKKLFFVFHFQCFAVYIPWITCTSRCLNLLDVASLFNDGPQFLPDVTGDADTAILNSCHAGHWSGTSGAPPSHSLPQSRAEFFRVTLNHFSKREFHCFGKKNMLSESFKNTPKYPKVG